MRELRWLLKLQRVNAFRLNEWRHTADKKQRRRLGGMLLAYAVLALMALVYSSALSWGYAAAGLAHMLPGAMATAASIAAALATLARVPGGLLAHREGDLLFSLPLKPGSVLLARLLDVYLPALATAVLVMAPAAVFYLMAVGFSWGALLRLVLIIVLLPLLPCALGIALGTAFAMVSARLKHRNLLLMLLSLLAMGLFFVWVYTAPLEMQDDAALTRMAVRSADALTAGWPPAAWAARGAAGDGPSLALFAGAGVLGAAAVWALMAPRYRELLQRLGRVRMGAIRADGRVRSPLAALVKKERARLMASPLYLMNTAVMAWLLPVVLALLMLTRPQLLQQLMALPGAAPLVHRMLPLAAMGFVGMSATTTIGLSMEGKSAWLMATAPVPPRTVYLSKLLLSVQNAWPACLLSAALLTLAFRPPWPAAAACLLLPMAAALFSAVLGLRIDLRHARYTWDNEQQIVKNSVQQLLAVSAAFLLMPAAGAALWFAGDRAPWAALGLAALLTAAALALFGRLSRRPLFIIP